MTGIIAQLGVFLVGAYFVLTGRGLTAGGVILFVNLMNFMIEPVTTLPALLAGRRAALGLMDQLADALAQHGTAAGQAELAPLTEGIRMEHVSFSYEPGREVLHDVSTTFEAGKAYAVVGGSGSGKSTLLNLLMAAGDYQGSIRLDGTELRDVLPESLHAVMSVIQQNVFVFNASIRDNVTMFRAFPQDALDDAIAHAHLTGLRPSIPLRRKRRRAVGRRKTAHLHRPDAAQKVLRPAGRRSDGGAGCQNGARRDQRSARPDRHDAHHRDP